MLSPSAFFPEHHNPHVTETERGLARCLVHCHRVIVTGLSVRGDGQTMSDDDEHRQPRAAR